jgi:hypothetical protein
VRWSVALLLLLACAGCGGAEDDEQARADEVRIMETTVGQIGGVSVGVSNIFEDTYTFPDGSEREGLTAGLTLFTAAEGVQQEYRVGEGNVVEIGGSRWEVVAIEKPEGELGAITLGPAPTAAG